MHTKDLAQPTAYVQPDAYASDCTVSRMVPAITEHDVSKHVGLTSKEPLLLDDDVFDALDSDVAKLLEDA